MKSLRGELCCVETEQGLRPFSGSPGGGMNGEVSGGLERERRAAPDTSPSAETIRMEEKSAESQNESGMRRIGEKSA